MVSEAGQTTEWALLEDVDEPLVILHVITSFGWIDSCLSTCQPRLRVHSINNKCGKCFNMCVCVKPAQEEQHSTMEWTSVRKNDSIRTNVSNSTSNRTTLMHHNESIGWGNEKLETSLQGQWPWWLADATSRHGKNIHNWFNLQYCMITNNFHQKPKDWISRMSNYNAYAGLLSICGATYVGRTMRNPSTRTSNSSNLDHLVDFHPAPQTSMACAGVTICES